jgi:lysozyme
MKMSSRGLALVKEFEGFRSTWYRCPAGVLTIGYGHTGRLPTGVAAPLTEAQGSRLLADRLAREFEPGVRAAVTVDLTDGQYSALVSFAYNVGLGNLKKSTLLKKVNARDFEGAAAEFAKWTRGGGRVLPGLVRRRQAEEALFRGLPA